ncbi:DctP family TRAP transporter solute-binding subunit [uncultured Mailhella sp.]|uniref:DctP family TRAP transporter solute-binding subunit n=1 Tax=uncultured Mailhella sp. TaxID=1981031 RepID=UPI002637EB85|nr:DctP family TRAP transporter solute-binding subunit [uncultured Mailhella sp.]
MKNPVRTVLLAAICLGLLSAPAAAAYKNEYKLSVVPSATSGWGLTGTYFADQVRERTQGRVNIKVYFGAQLMAGKQTSELLLVRRGAIDFALASTINWSPQIEELNLPALPFFIANNPDRYKAMDAIEAGKSGKMLEAAIEKTGVKFLGWSENGFRELTTSKGPINKPEDMKGMKLRVCGTPIFADIFTALGSNPQAINWSEAVTGFQQGIVDGQENPTNGINIPLQIWTWHKYHTDWHYMIDPLFLTVNDKVWKSFSAEDQKIILDCAKDAEKYGKALSRLGFDDGSALRYLESIGMVPAVTDPYKVMEEKGMTVTRFTPEQIAEFYKATQGVRDTWTTKIGVELVKAAEEDMKAAQ